MFGGDLKKKHKTKKSLNIQHKADFREFTNILMCFFRLVEPFR